MGSAIEVIANVLYLIEHDPDDPARVRLYTQFAKPAVEVLLKHARSEIVADKDSENRSI